MTDAGAPKASLEAIGKGASIVEQKPAPDEKDRLEDDVLRGRQRRAEIGALEQANRDRVATRRLRYRYAKQVYRYLCFYTVGAATLLVLTGFKKLTYFEIPDAVLTVIVGSTAVAAIGLVGFVVSGLFKGPN